MADSSAFDSGSRPHKLAVAVSWPYSLGQKAPGWKRKKKKTEVGTRRPRGWSKRKKRRTRTRTDGDELLTSLRPSVS